MNEQNQQELDQAQKISQVLTQSCEQLSDRTIIRLQKSREAAVQAQAAQYQTALTFNTGHFAHLLPHTGMQWVIALAMLAIFAMGAANYWQHTSEQALSHVDLAILTDDLPLEVFVDK